MRTVQCKKLGSVASLTVGNVYEIISETASRFTIANDKGVQMQYGKNLFNDPVEVPEPQAENNVPPGFAPRRRGPGRPRNAAIGEGGRMLGEQPAQIPAPVAARPVPAPIPVVDQIEVNTSADNHNGEVSFRAVFSFIPGAQFVYNTPRIIYTNGISASCGIQSLSGIDDLNMHINSMRSGFMDYVNAERQRFTLSADIDITNLFEEISVAFIQDLVATYQGEDSDIKAGILILSTTVASIDQQPCLRRALNNAAISNIPVHNPNSGNDIVMWNIAVEA